MWFPCAVGAQPVTRSDTPWHNSLVERHGQVLGEIVEASVEACHIEGYDEMKLVAICAASIGDQKGLDILQGRESLELKSIGQEL